VRCCDWQNGANAGKNLHKEVFNARETRSLRTPPHSAKPTTHSLEQFWALLAPEMREKALAALGRVVASQISPPPNSQEASNDQ